MSRPSQAAGLVALRSFLEDLENATAIATTLAKEGHPIDLDGFDGQIGLLCAKTLDLPLEQGLTLRPALLRLRERLETLELSLPRPADLFRPP
jgi:hypothetical protein